jgi:hypothetical protein
MGSSRNSSHRPAAAHMHHQSDSCCVRDWDGACEHVIAVSDGKLILVSVLVLDSSLRIKNKPHFSISSFCCWRTARNGADISIMLCRAEWMENHWLSSRLSNACLVAAVCCCRPLTWCWIFFSFSIKSMSNWSLDSNCWERDCRSWNLRCGNWQSHNKITSFADPAISSVLHPVRYPDIQSCSVYQKWVWVWIIK